MQTFLVRITLFLLLLFAMIGVGIAARAQDLAVLTFSEYEKELQNARVSLQSAPNPTLALRTVQDRLQKVLTVTLPSGVELSISPLLQDVSDSAIALQRIETALDQMERAGSDQTDTRLTALQTVLDRRPVNPLAQWWDRFIRWLRDFLRQYESDAPMPTSVIKTSETTAWIILGIAALLIALLLGYWLQGILRDIVSERRLRRTNEGDLPATATEAREEAQQLARTGNYREAVRYLYLAALLGLDESGLIRYDRTLTNREVLAQAQHEPALQTHLRPVVDMFDDVWYGIHEPDEQHYKGYVREIDELEAMVKHHE